MPKDSLTDRSTPLRRAVPDARLALACLALLCGGLWLAAQPADPQLEHLRVMASRHLLMGVNPGDAQAAGTVWVQTLGRAEGRNWDAHFEIAADLDTLKRNIEDSTADLVIVDGMEYAKLASTGLLHPLAAVAQGKNNIGQKHFLVVSRSSGYYSVVNLRGKSIFCYARPGSELAMVWIDTLLNQRRLEPATRYFGSIVQVGKPTSACLPVFFHKADACVVDSSGWDVLTSQNGQLFQELRIIASSPAYPQTLVCLHSSREDLRTRLLRDLLDPHRSAEAKPLLTVLKGDRLLPASDQDMEGIRDLWSQHVSIVAPKPGAVKAETASRRP